MRRATFAAIAVSASLISAAPAARADWSLGPIVSVIGGISDVSDLTERNLRNEPGVIAVDIYDIPIGAGLLARNRMDSGLQVDLSIGPAFAMISGDVSHWEIPLYATVGYAFASASDTSPYIRVGAAHHIVDGDYELGSDPGVFVGVGIEFNRNDSFTWGLELAVDDSSVEFLDPAIPGNRELNTYDTMLSVFFTF